jgi:hypothetical protein
MTTLGEPEKKGRPRAANGWVCCPSGTVGTATRSAGSAGQPQVCGVHHFHPHDDGPDLGERGDGIAGDVNRVEAAGRRKSSPVDLGGASPEGLWPARETGWWSQQVLVGDAAGPGAMRAGQRNLAQDTGQPGDREHCLGRDAGKGVLQNRDDGPAIPGQDGVQCSAPAEIGVRCVDPDPNRLGAREKFKKELHNSFHGLECLLNAFCRRISMNRLVVQAKGLREAFERQAHKIS